MGRYVERPRVDVDERVIDARVGPWVDARVDGAQAIDAQANGEWVVDAWAISEQVDLWRDHRLTSMHGSIRGETTVHRPVHRPSMHEPTVNGSSVHEPSMNGSSMHGSVRGETTG